MELSDASFVLKRLAPSRGEVRRAAQALDSACSDAELSLLVRALAREKRIELPEYLQQINCSPGTLRRGGGGDNSGHSGTSAASTSSTASEWPTAVVSSSPARHPSFIGVRTQGGSGTTPPARLYSQSPKSGKLPVSTAVTRSIGDWDASRAMVPHPELQHFSVVGAAGEHQRVVIASDGVWDFVTCEEAGRKVRAAPSPQAAADALVSLATKRSKARLNYLKDDTSCVVVDLNPARRAFEPPASAAGGGGCPCTIS